MIQNIGKLFYKDYYNNINFEYVLDDSKVGTQDKQITEINDRIKESELIKIPVPVDYSDYFLCFNEKVLYPGLITGVGIIHDSKKLAGGYNMGMHFDYTFGMPIVYGSSIKGVLRDYFKRSCISKKLQDGTEIISYDDDLFTSISKRNINISELFEDIFNGKKLEKQSNGKSIYVNKSIYKRDIFFDAVIVNPFKDKFNKSHIVDDDAITPHKNGPLKNPIPITMLKIAPGCILEFRFHLNDFISNNDIKFTAKEKLELFKNILEKVGIGAKTNVGYGQLTSNQ